MVVHMTWVWTFFNNYSNHPRMCVLSTLCGNVDKHSPFDTYIYIYMKRPLPGHLVTIYEICKPKPKMWLYSAVLWLSYLFPFLSLCHYSGQLDIRLSILQYLVRKSDAPLTDQVPITNLHVYDIKPGVQCFLAPTRASFSRPTVIIQCGRA